MLFTFLRDAAHIQWPFSMEITKKNNFARLIWTNLLMHNYMDPFFDEIVDPLLCMIVDQLFDEFVDPFFHQIVDPVLDQIADPF